MNDIFTLAELEQRNIGLLSGEFLADVRRASLKNRAVELLESPVKDEICSNSRKNFAQEKKHSERLLGMLAKV